MLNFGFVEMKGLTWSPPCKKNYSVISRFAGACIRKAVPLLWESLKFGLRVYLFIIY